ncbi:MAG: hypothetical protein H8D56_16465 [Planctomycetes bacterium]|nr:hypothetical protein [Planctomycetota bacterium]MBL7144000.1 hypothetical protein [Phycisphaerae bacterium]
MSVSCIWKFVGAEAAKTVITLTTTAIVGGVVWLITLRKRSTKLESLLSNQHRSFNLYYRGDEKKELNKSIHFLPDGKIDKPNGNEDYWRIRLGSLEILTSGRKVFSKFKWDSKKGRLVHTNDPKLPSAMGQYIVPSVIPAAKQADIYAK